VPRVADPLAARWTKGVARLVKYLREIDRAGPALAQAELEDLSTLIGRKPSSLAEARAELAGAVTTGAVSDADYVRYLWRQVQRDDYLMRDASGALRDRTWPPLF
jgi:hypothetical protein